jgi:hypothetical protein
MSSVRWTYHAIRYSLSPFLQSLPQLQHKISALQGPESMLNILHVKYPSIGGDSKFFGLSLLEVNHAPIYCLLSVLLF